MTDDPRSLPYDTADYLKTPEDIAGFLEAVMEDYDERTFVSALQSAIRAAKRVMPGEMAGFSDNQDESSFARLSAFLHALGYEFHVRPKSPRREE